MATNFYPKHIFISCGLLGALINSIAQTPTNETHPAASNIQPRTVPAAYGASTVVNYIRTWDVPAPLSTEVQVASSQNLQEVKQTTAYFDGLGRPLQSVTKKSTPSGKDFVSPVLYDPFGRQVYSYLPYASVSSDGNFKMDPFTEQASCMQNIYNPTSDPDGEKFFYSKTDYESSSFNRVTKTYAAGNSWVRDGVGISTESLLNTSADNVHIWTISFNSGSLPVNTGIYGANQLYKTILTDETGHKTAEYKDKEGHVILKKVELASSHTGTFENGAYDNWISTYYVYDDLGNLRFVMQPKAVAYLTMYSWNFDGTNLSSSAVAKGLCFSYEYDPKHRMVIKHVPDAGQVYMVYDARDRLVMVQDENLRLSNKWLCTIYDNENRPVQTGLLTDNNSLHDRAWHQLQADASTNYPATTANFETLTETYYDTYDWVTAAGTSLKKALITSNINNANYFYQSVDNSAPVFPYAQTIKASYQNKGMVTGTKTEVLGTNPNVYLYAVNFYDDRGRQLQTQSYNYSNMATPTKDTVTMQYSFSGQVLRVLIAHQKGGTNKQFYRVGTRNEYDDAGRIITVKKIIGDQFKVGLEVKIAQNTYDELGQLKQKDLGQQVDASNISQYTYYPNTPVDILKYEYNIRGWLRGINKDYARNEGGTGRWFGIELCYDYGFSSKQLNGNISGERWRTKGDGEQRAYGFSYDYLSRLTGAEFNQYNSGWLKTISDFTVSNLTYDENGNIKTMKQMGMSQSSIKPVDDLAYTPKNYSNQLDHVTDASNDFYSVLSDFKEPATGSGSGASQDYSFDANGNLIKDLNKGIGNSTTNGIIYNYLNLPSVITVFNQDAQAAMKGTIAYTYDAAGNRIIKVTDELASANNNNTHTITTTSYFGSFVYEQKNVTVGSNQPVNTGPDLQYIVTEEGRSRPATAGKVDTMFYDYFEKDHLGNVRVVLTDQKKQDVYPAATLEGDIAVTADAIYIEKDYYDINTANIVGKSTVLNLPAYINKNGGSNALDPPVNNNPNGLSTANSKKLYKLHASSTAGVTGLGITLRVMSGDAVDIYGKSYWHNTGTITNDKSLSSLLLSFLTSFTRSSAVKSAGHSVSDATLYNNTNTAGPLSGWLSNGIPNPGNVMPKASINWVFFDEQFRPVSTSCGYDMISSASDNLKDHHKTVTIPRNGYLYVYCSNESNTDVFFDNLQVVHTRGPLIEETHYYPFGLTMAGISSKALNFGGCANDIRFQSQKFQNNEFSDGSGLETYEFKYRMNDPQTGRFWSVDPLADKYVYNSPYDFSEDKVTSHIELEGLEAVPYSNPMQALEDAMTKTVQAVGQWLDRISFGTSVTTETNLPSEPGQNNILQTTTTVTTSLNITPTVDYIRFNNTNAGNTAPLTKTTTTTTVDATKKVQTNTPVGKIDVSKSINNKGTITNTANVTTGKGIKYGFTISNDSRGTKTFTGFTSAGTENTNVNGSLTITTNSTSGATSVKASMGASTKSNAGKISGCLFIKVDGTKKN